MKTISLAPNERPAARLARVVLRVALAAWAIPWCGFAIAVAAHEGRPAIVPAGSFVLAVLGSATLAWLRPAVGGAVLVAAGVAAWFVFQGAFAHQALALPAIAIGLAVAALAWTERRRATPRSPERGCSRARASCSTATAA